ncbi:hypothetical protein AA0472_2035 [Acetobacter estunensis NRIC 0472]|uniref:hypothetical protein n=1 Tax=Acetobacter estunensis TaxID=104097 RepID=UPI001F54988B|nr:hypothetical protein [Acetobacter estunensis]GBQ26211.1 hypothetical protein AA0472_2035 [Acetobacter estunensis NRIC 0472]
MKRSFSILLSLSTMCLLSGCLSVPHPFSHPGKETQNLTDRTATSRLDVPVPKDEASGDAVSKLWAQQVTEALLEQSVPAIAQPVRPGDWWLRLHTERRGDVIVPLYSVMTPKGTIRATQEGPGVSVADWNAANPDAIHTASMFGAGQVANTLTGIMAQDMEDDPHSLKHRGARIWFQGVTGAPGDGDVSLAQAFVAAFRGMKDSIQSSRTDADFIVATTVKLTDGPEGTHGHPLQHIRIDWRATDKDGHEVGIATQLHDISAHELDGMWGDVAMAAAGEAAGAVEEMITRYSSRDAKPIPDTTKGNGKKAATPQTAAPGTGG